MKCSPTSALFFLAVCTVVVGCGRAGNRQQGATTARPTIEALAPKGEASFPLVFEWKATAPGPDPLYRLTIYDGAERQLLEQETRAQQVRVPADEQQAFGSARRFLWRAAVVDATGAVLAETPLVECTVR